MTERVHAREQYEHFVGAWNAVSYRYRAMADCGRELSQLLGAAHDAEHRYKEERSLFSFFSTAFSVFESYFYGMYAVGCVLDPANFPLASPRDQQAVSPASTKRAYGAAFIGDPILPAFEGVLNDPEFKELRDVRNILTHRAAPGRQIFLAIGTELDLPSIWRLNGIPLDQHLAGTRQTAVARRLTVLMRAAADFIELRLP